MAHMTGMKRVFFTCTGEPHRTGFQNYAQNPWPAGLFAETSGCTTFRTCCPHITALPKELPEWYETCLAVPSPSPTNNMEEGLVKNPQP